MVNNCLALQPPSKQHTSNRAEGATNKKPAQTTQRDRLYALLYAHKNEDVGLPAILELRIAQFGARIKELRELGADIRNRRETRDGTTHSWYMLVVPESSDVAVASVTGGAR
jgi:hypothetical protein